MISHALLSTKKIDKIKYSISTWNKSFQISKMKAFYSAFHLLVITVFSVNSTAIPSKNTPLKIIDGSEVTPHSLPYMVAIRTNIDGRPVTCGGSLLTTAHVLTAARCLYGASEAEVVLGAHTLDEDETSQVVMRSTEFTIHDEYISESKTHDIALITLPSAAQLNEYTAVINPPSHSEMFNSYDGQEGIVAGWGKTSDTANATSSVLRAVNLTIIPVLMCEITQAFQITSDQMCTSGVSVKNTCLGDAGSPLVVDGVQVGIASYGSDFGCGVGFPGVYTRLTSYLNWLGTSLG